MKPIFTALFTMTFCAFGFSQINPSIDILGGVDYSYRTLRTDSDQNTYLLVLKKRNVETPKLNWRIGINYNKKLLNNIYLKSGIRLSSTGYKAPTNTEILWSSEHESSNNNSFRDNFRICNHNR